MKMTEKNTKIESTNTFIPGNSVLAKPMFPLYKNELRKASKPQTINEFVIETKQIVDVYPSKKNGDHVEANSIIKISNFSAISFPDVWFPQLILQYLYSS